jgi:hypothetical protein
LVEVILNFRFNLLQDVEVDIDERTRELSIEVTNCSFLTESERQATTMFQINNEFNPCKQKEEESTTVIKLTIPERAVVESIGKYEHDTEYGWLLEILFEKRKVLDKTKLRGKRMSHVVMSAKSLVTLANKKSSDDGNMEETNDEVVHSSQ